MEAKETVMSDEQIGEVYGNLNTEYFTPNTWKMPRKIAEAQAEISFKAGCKHALEGAVMEGGYESVKKAGIREVVEWLGRAKKIKVPKYQLKEWGI